MHVHVVDLGTIYKPHILKLISKNIKHLSKITIQHLKKPHRELMEEADLIILTGGTWMVKDNPGTHRRLIKMVLESNKPVIGICLGAESLAHYFGGKLEKLPKRISGLENIRVVDNGLALELGGNEFTVFEHHIWQINSLPKELKALAVSQDGVEIFVHNTLPIIGMQFHPETRKGYNDGAKIFSQLVVDVLGIV